MSKAIMRNATQFLCMLLISCPLIAAAEETSGYAVDDAMVFEISLSNDLSLEDIGGGGFDIRVTKSKKQKLFFATIDDCVENVRSVMNKWIGDNNYVLLKSVVDKGERYFSHYADQKGGFYECLYRVNREKQQASLQLYRYDSKGRPNALGVDDPHAKIMKQLAETMRCKK